MPYKIGGKPRPSEELDALLLGKMAWNDAPDAIRSWASFYFYEAAVQIVAEPGLGNRRNMLARIPANVRPRVAAEVKRLWGLRSE